MKPIGTLSQKLILEPAKHYEQLAMSLEEEWYVNISSGEMKLLRWPEVSDDSLWFKVTVLEDTPYTQVRVKMKLDYDQDPYAMSIPLEYVIHGPYTLNEIIAKEVDTLYFQIFFKDVLMSPQVFNFGQKEHGKTPFWWMFPRRDYF